MPARPKLSLASLTTEDLAALTAQIKAAEVAEAEAKKANREKGKAVTSDIVTLVTTSDLGRETFQSTAEGWSLGGKNIEGADGKKYRVQVLIRDEATIPPKEA